MENAAPRSTRTFKDTEVGDKMERGRSVKKTSRCRTTQKSPQRKSQSTARSRSAAGCRSKSSTKSTKRSRSTSCAKKNSSACAKKRTRSESSTDSSSCSRCGCKRKRSSKCKPARKRKVKRPLTAYLVFVAENLKNTCLTKENMRATMRKLGCEWQSLDAREKNVYQCIADKRNKDRAARTKC